MRHVFMALALAVALAAPAAAQTDEARVFVRPVVGATVGAGPGAAFGAAANFKVAGRTQITGEFGRMTNILPDSVAEEVEVAAALAANTLGGKHSSSASASATYGLVGIRHALRDVGGANTFIEIGVGAARVTSDVSAVIRGSAALQGDISNLVTTPFTTSTPDTRPLASIGGGIILGVTRAMAIEAGYRYVRVFTKNPAINMSNVFGGLRFGF